MRQQITFREQKRYLSGLKYFCEDHSKGGSNLSITDTSGGYNTCDIDFKMIILASREPATVTVCLTCPTPIATNFVARRRHGSLSRNIQEELEAALLFQQHFIR